MVDHAASGGKHQPERRPIDLRGVPLATVRHGGGLHRALLHAPNHPHAHGNSRPPCARRCSRRNRLMPPFLDMGKYAAFVWPAYGISAIGIVAAALLTLRGYY